MMEGIRNFYIENIAARETLMSPEGVRVKISPITRLEFYLGSALATVFLVQKAAQSIFYLIAAVFTCFHNENIKEALRFSGKEACVLLGAVFIGNLGFFIPETTNDYILRIPVEGILIPSAYA